MVDKRANLCYVRMFPQNRLNPYSGDWMNYQDLLLKRMKLALEERKFPHSPEDIVGKRFRLICGRATLVSTDDRESFDPDELLQEDSETVLENRGESLGAYILYGTITGIDYFDELDEVLMYISPCHTSLGHICQLWLDGDGAVSVQVAESDTMHFKKEYLHDNIRGVLTLL